MQSTPQNSDQWSDDAIKTLLAYGGWSLEWSDDDGQWLVHVPQHSIVGALFPTLQDVHAYYLDYMKWWNDGDPEVPVR